MMNSFCLFSDRKLDFACILQVALFPGSPCMQMGIGNEDTLQLHLISDLGPQELFMYACIDY